MAHVSVAGRDLREDFDRDFDEGVGGVAMDVKLDRRQSRARVR